MADEGLVLQISGDNSELNDALEESKRLVQSASGSIDDLYKQLDKLVSAQNRVGEGTAMWHEYEAGIAATADEIQKAESVQQELGVVVERTTASLESQKNVQLAFNRVIKDAHALTYSTTRGISELTYALPNLGSKLAQVAEETGSWKTAMTQIGGSLLTWQTLLFSAGTALALYFRGHHGGKEAVDEHTKSLEEFTKGLEKAKEGAMTQNVKLSEAISIAKDHSRTLAERNNALKTANELMGEHGEKLTLASIETAKGTTEIEKYTQALINQALASKYADRIAEMMIKQSEAVKVYTKAKEAQAVAEANLNRYASQGIGQGLQGEYEHYERLKKSTAEAAKGYRTINDEVINLMGTFNQLSVDANKGMADVGYKDDKAAKNIDKIAEAFKKLNDTLIDANHTQAETSKNMDPARLAAYTNAWNTLERLGLAPADERMQSISRHMKDLSWEIEKNKLTEFTVKYQNNISSEKAKPLDISDTYDKVKPNKEDSFLVKPSKDAQDFINIQAKLMDQLHSISALYDSTYGDADNDLEKSKATLKAYEQEVKSLGALAANNPMYKFFLDQAVAQEKAAKKTVDYEDALKKLDDYVAKDLTAVFDKFFSDLLTNGEVSIDGIIKMIEEMIIKMTTALAVEKTLGALGYGGGDQGAAGGSSLGGILSTVIGAAFLRSPAQTNHIQSLNMSGGAQSLTTVIRGQDLQIIQGRAARANQRKY